MRNYVPIPRYKMQQNIFWIGELIFYKNIKKILSYLLYMYNLLIYNVIYGID